MTVEQDFIFTFSQEIGIDKLDAFLRSNERIFLLTGKAGTGKTTIIKYGLEIFLKYDRVNQGPKHNYVMGIAVAHKAKENLRKSIPYVNTFAKTFGQRETIDEEGNTLFVVNNKSLEHADCQKKWKVVVVDECSMFNRKMLRMVLEYLDSSTKIIFMGDRGQLPPIEEGDTVANPDEDSPVFGMNLPKSCRHELTERVRQTDGNSIISLSDIIYGEIFGGRDLVKVFNAIHRSDVDSNGLGYESIEGPNMYEKFANSSKDNFLDTKLLAYRRVTVDDYNKYLRNYIHYDPQDAYIPNEIIYMNGGYMYDKGYGPELIHNSSEHIIKEVYTGEVEGIPVWNVGIGNDMVLPTVKGPRNSNAMQLYFDRLREYKSKKDWLGRRAFLENFANFSYGYTLTAYRAQGSTYKNIFVDVNDIFAVKPISKKRKLQALYTSVTRAAHNINFIK